MQLRGNAGNAGWILTKRSGPTIEKDVQCRLKSRLRITQGEGSSVYEQAKRVAAHMRKESSLLGHHIDEAAALEFVKVRSCHEKIERYFEDYRARMRK